MAMFKSRTVLLLSLLGVALLLGGCFVPTGGGVFDIQSAFRLELDAEAYSYNATLDFGPVDPDAGPTSVVAELVNLTEFDITIVTATVTTTAFTLTTPVLPATVSAGESVEVTLSFNPDASAVFNTVLSATVEGAEMPFTLNLRGEGNYPPTAADAVVISGAGVGGDPVDAGANGLYYHNGSLNSSMDSGPISYYEKSDTGHRLYGANVEGVWWYLDASTDGSDIRYEIDYMGPSGPTDIPTVQEWFAVNGTGTPPTSIGPFDMPNPGYVALGDIITVNHHYQDVEDDLEGTSTFQWYLSDTSDPLGTYTALSETGPSIKTVSAHSQRYLMVEVTPQAATGTVVGEPVMIGPTPLVDPLQG